jgi:hypothetical protein
MTDSAQKVKWPRPAERWMAGGGHRRGVGASAGVGGDGAEYKSLSRIIWHNAACSACYNRNIIR